MLSLLALEPETSLSSIHELSTLFLLNLSKKDLLLFSATCRLHRQVLSESARYILKLGVGVILRSDPHYSGLEVTPEDLVKVLKSRDYRCFGDLVPVSAFVAPCFTLVTVLHCIYGDEVIQIIHNWPPRARGASFPPHPMLGYSSTLETIRDARALLVDIALRLDNYTALSIHSVSGTLETRRNGVLPMIPTTSA